MSSLFERIGGEDAVDAAVDIFYNKVIVDDRINHFFKNLDMAAQARKLKAFLTVAFGGPNNYDGKGMRAGHVHLGLTSEHFDAVVENLADTLKQLSVSGSDIQEIAAIAETARADVLGL